MKKTSRKISYMLRHGFTALFSFAIMMAVGVNGFSYLINSPSGNLSTEALSNGTNMQMTQANLLSEGLPVSIYYVFVGFLLVTLVITLVYLRKVSKAKVRK